MAMTLRLTDEETRMLRDAAAREGRSMQETARAAIREYAASRTERIDSILDRILVEDAELLDRLSK